ncbi:unnamed protein product [Symbiodinium sp. CCMP2456]|nr:unnamed protein product [Symbiodinium sp. CCMP2456]
MTPAMEKKLFEEKIKAIVEEKLFEEKIEAIAEESFSNLNPRRKQSLDSDGDHRSPRPCQAAQRRWNAKKWMDPILEAIINESFVGLLSKKPVKERHADQSKVQEPRASGSTTQLGSFPDKFEHSPGMAVDEDAFQNFVDMSSLEALGAAQQMIESRKASCDKLLAIISERRDRLKAHKVQENRRAVFNELERKFAGSR